MLYKLLLEPKPRTRTPMGILALELAVALGHPTVALSGYINQVFFTTNKPTHRTPFSCQIVRHTYKVLYKLLLKSKLQKLTPMGLQALELAVAPGHPTVALSGHINQVVFTTNKPTHSVLLPNCSPYLQSALQTIA